MSHFLVQVFYLFLFGVFKLFYRSFVEIWWDCAWVCYYGGKVAPPDHEEVPEKETVKESERGGRLDHQDEIEVESVGLSGD